MTESLVQDAKNLEGSTRLQSVAIQVEDTVSTATKIHAVGRTGLANKEAWAVLSSKNTTFILVVLASSLTCGVICTMVSFNFDFFKVCT